MKVLLNLFLILSTIVSVNALDYTGIKNKEVNQISYQDQPDQPQPQPHHPHPHDGGFSWGSDFQKSRNVIAEFRK